MRSNAATTRTMLNLRPGDVITGLKLEKYKDHKILVLGRQGDGYFDFSKAGQAINIQKDSLGPYRWEERDSVFRSKEGAAQSLIGSDAKVLEGSGMVQLGWYRQMPTNSVTCVHIDPDNMLGTVSEPGTMAKMNALLDRSKSGTAAEHIRDVTLAIEMIFAGSELALTERHLCLLHILINGAARVRASKISQTSGIDILMGIMGMGGGMPSDLDAIFGDMGKATGSRSRGPFPFGFGNTRDGGLDAALGEILAQAARSERHRTPPRPGETRAAR